MDYMNPLNKLAWRAALRKRAPQVVLNDGSKFKLTYLTGGPRPYGTVFFEPVTTLTNLSLVPRGTLDIEKVLDDDWLD